MNKKEFNIKCKNIQIEIGKMLMDDDLTLRDICGILDMTKHFFVMEKWEEL